MDFKTEFKIRVKTSDLLRIIFMDSDTYFSVDLAFNYIKSKKPTNNNNNLTSFLLIEFYLD